MLAFFGLIEGIYLLSSQNKACLCTLILSRNEPVFFHLPAADRFLSLYELLESEFTWSLHKYCRYMMYCFNFLWDSQTLNLISKLTQVKNVIRGNIPAKH